MEKLGLLLAAMVSHLLKNIIITQLRSMLIALNTIVLPAQCVHNAVQIIILKLTIIAGLHAATVLEHLLIQTHGLVTHALQGALLALV